jgi:hypothetical protein
MSVSADTQLANLKILLGITDTSEDSLLTLLLSNAQQLVINAAYPYQDDTTATYTMPDRYAGVQVEAALRMYNMRGAEGETSHLENGVSRYYESVNEYVANNVTPYCGRVVITSTTATSG